MKRTQITELFANVRATAVSFFSILLFVSLGVALYCGMCWTSAANEGATNASYLEMGLHDLEVTFPYGLTADDIAAIGEVDGVSQVEGGYVSYQSFDDDGVPSVIALRSLPGEIDSLTVVEGELPSEVGQAAVNEVYAKSHDLSVGDAITLTHDGGEGDATAGDAADGEDDAAADDAAAGDAGDAAAGDAADGEVDAAAGAATVDDAAAGDAAGDASATASDGMANLKTDTYTVTAIVYNSASLLDSEGALGMNDEGRNVSCLLFVPEQTFDLADIDNCYNVAEVRCDELRAYSYYSDEYLSRADEIAEAVKQAGTSRAAERSQAVVAKAQAKVDDAAAELEAARQQVADGTDQLDAAQDQISQSVSELENAQAKLEATTELLASQSSANAVLVSQTQAQIAETQALHDEAAAQLAAKQVEYATALSTYGATYQQAVAAQTYVATVDAALTSLDSTKLGLDAKLESGEIDQASYEVALAYACGEFDQAAQGAAAKLQQGAPAFYEQNQGAISAIAMGYVPYSSDYDESLHACYLNLAEVKASQAQLQQQAAQDQQAAEALKDEVVALNTKVAALQGSITAAQAQLDATSSALNAQVAAGQAQAAEGSAQIAGGQAQVESGQAELDERRSELAQATERLEASTAELKSAQERVDSISEMSWSVTSSRSNTCVRGVSKTSDSIRNLRVSMASLFLVVGLLVCYSAVSRIVHEQVVLVGTKKANGFYDREVTMGYLAYSALAVLAGCVLGAALACLGLEGVLLHALHYTVLPQPGAVFVLSDLLVIGGVELALIELATLFACRSVLKASAIELLQGGQAPSSSKRFYERWGVWRRLGLFTQTVINNCVNDRRRVLATVVGVAGCCSLIVCALYLKDNVDTSIARQTSAVFTFDGVVYADVDEEEAAAQTSSGDGAAETSEAQTSSGDSAAEMGAAETSASGVPASTSTVSGVLNAEGLAHAAVMRKTLSLRQPNGDYTVANVTVPQNFEDFGELFHLYVEQAADGVQVPVDGVWMSSGYARYFGAKVGDAVTLANSLGQSYEVPIAGFFECHTTHLAIVMSASAYERYLDETPAYNAYLVDSGERGLDALVGELRGASDFGGCEDVMTDVRLLKKSSVNLTMTIVGIYVALAVLMAVVVLLNLNVMFINEKKFELIVLMINGYSTRDAKRYVYRDNIVITAIGIVIGCVLGLAAGDYSLRSCEAVSIAFVHQMSWLAVACGAVLTALFSAAVTAIALRKIDNFSLTDINKL